MPKRSETMLLIKLLSDVYLPRFTMQKDTLLHIRKEKVGPDGFGYGGGWLENRQLEVMPYRSAKEIWG